ncbi:TPA: LamG domain-containing protein [Candidatus Poribacteria bacterium]|nr:LamG domain-containing protein [Candidatus Poribacteria bacterium]HIN29252.1 LamG domain-containing protein [Candidatus Poribacteria bacterium]
MDPEAVIGIWLLDEDKGGVAEDSSGNGHDGKIIGDRKVVKAKFNKGFEFKGKLNNYISVPHDKSLNLAEFTIAYWCKMGVSGKWQIPVQKVDFAVNGSHRNVDFQTPPAGGNVSVYFSQGANQWRGANGKTEVSDEKWHHIAGSYDLDALLLYVDGVLEGEGDHDGKPDFMDDPLMLGSGKIWPFMGIIDDVGIFSKALSADDIKNIMNKGLSSTLAVVSLSGKLTTTWAEIKK